MKLAQDSRNSLQEFFRELLSDEDFRLPAINFYGGKISNLITKILQVHGITFGRHIFIHPNLIGIDFENRLKLSLELAAHEIVHVLQYKKEGFLKFFYKYLTGYWRNLQKKSDWSAHSRHEAYREISFEQEAREVAAEFVKWTRNRKSTD